MVPLLQYCHGMRPQKFHKKQTHWKSGQQMNQYGSMIYQDPKTQKKDQTTIVTTVIDLLLVTPMIPMILMMDDHPDRDHLRTTWRATQTGPTRWRTTSRTTRESKSMDTLPSQRKATSTRRPPQGLPLPGPPLPPPPAPANNQGTNNKFKFDKRIKISDIATWDGNSKIILEWLNKLNHIAYCSHAIFTNLGTIAPLHLTAATEQWFHTLPTAMISLFFLCSSPIFLFCSVLLLLRTPLHH